MSTTALTPEQMAYDAYMNGRTVAGKQGLHHPDQTSVRMPFVDYVEGYQAINPHSVPVNHLVTGEFSRQTFYQTAMSRTFHVLNGVFEPPQYGSGNTLLVEFRYDPSTNDTTIRYIGFQGIEERRIEANVSSLHSNSLILDAGLVYANLKMLRGQRVDGINVWVHELATDGNLRARYYLVPFEF